MTDSARTLHTNVTTFPNHSFAPKSTQALNKLLLYLALLPASLWRGAGADVDQLRAILDVRLRMDDRKPLNFGRQGREKKNRRFTSALGVFVSCITGMLYIFSLLLISDRVLALTAYFTLFLFLLSFSLITDFSNVLVDTRDKYILLPKPVSGRTLFLARILHIGIYLFRIVIPMSLPGWICVGLAWGWKSALWFPLPVFLLTLTALFLVMGTYLLILRIASAEKFKEILSYFQIAFSIFIFAFSYLGQRLWTPKGMYVLDPQQYLWARYLPSYWLAATYTWVKPAAGIKGTFLLSLLAVAVPLTAVILIVKYLAPKFAALLGGLDAVEGISTPASRAAGRKSTGRVQSIARVFNRTPGGEAGFLMAWLQTARNRSFKMKVYPMFAYVPIYFVYMMMTKREQPLSQSWRELPGTSKHLVLLYMCSVVLVQALSFMTVSEQYRAAWIYDAVPLQTPGSIMGGAFKAMWVKYFLPFFGAVSIFVLSVWGLGAWSDVLLAGTNATLFAAAIARLNYRRFPFSSIDQMNSAGSRFMRGLLSLIIPLGMGFGHYIAIDLLWLKLIFLTLSLLLLWLVLDSYASTSWADVQRARAQA